MKRVVKCSQCEDIDAIWEEADLHNSEIVVSYLTNSFEEGSSQRFPDGQEDKAVKAWFQLSMRYPTLVCMYGVKYQGEAVHDWVCRNRDTVSKWAKQYKCPYKIEYILSACEKPCRQSETYPDQIHPFCFG